MSNDDAKTTATTTEVIVTPPTLAPTGGWQKYELEFCPVNPAGACIKQFCSNPPQPSPTTTVCPITGLTPNTNYTVQAWAINGTTQATVSLPSNKDDFVTKPDGFP